MGSRTLKDHWAKPSPSSEAGQHSTLRLECPVRRTDNGRGGGIASEAASEDAVPTRITNVLLPNGRQAAPIRGEKNGHSLNRPPGIPAWEAGTHISAVAGANIGLRVGQSVDSARFDILSSNDLSRGQIESSYVARTAALSLQRS
jgi:hypothetical protein